jgi:hypothetical protein
MCGTRARNLPEWNIPHLGARNRKQSVRIEAWENRRGLCLAGADYKWGRDTKKKNRNDVYFSQFHSIRNTDGQYQYPTVHLSFSFYEIERKEKERWTVGY